MLQLEFGTLNLLTDPGLLDMHCSEYVETNILQNVKKYITGASSVK